MQLYELLPLWPQITRRDEEMAPFVAEVKRNYIFGGICGIAANASIKVCLDMIIVMENVENL